MNDNDHGCVIYDFWDLGEYVSAEYHTFGDWWSVTYNGGSDETEFEDADHDFQPFMQGWLLVPDVHQLAYLEIVAVADGEITVKGNAENMAAEGTQYWLIAPAGVSATTGATETNPEKMPNPWLWAGYHYLPPIAGFRDPQGQDPGVYGKQPGQNQAGQYDCWNRRYEPQTGRWTTPDPAETPWTNLHAYSVNSLSHSDPMGLAIQIAKRGGGTVEWQNRVVDWLNRICPGANVSVNRKTGVVSSGVPDFCTENTNYGVSYCDIPDPPQQPWQRIAGSHPKGCELIHCILCSDKKITIDQGTAEFEPDNWGDAMKHRPKGVKQDDKDGYENSKGSGGVVRLPTGWNSSGRKWQGANDTFTPSFPRLLAHELAHACRGMHGAMKLVGSMGDQGCWKRSDGYSNDEEYDVITEWENVIARELASDPATRSNSSGKDIESGTGRTSHGLARSE